VKWRKLGLIYGPDGTLPWALTHAMVPTPYRISREIIRIFFSSCDKHGVARPSYIDVAGDNPTNILYIHDRPLFDIGVPGTFDENGILPCSVAPTPQNQIYMYYAGFELGTKIRYRLLTGLAISQDGGSTFKKTHTTPILERTPYELFIRGGPYCLHDAGHFKLWYVAGSRWEEINKKSSPIYDIRYAESNDGIHWPSEGKTVIPVSKPDEYGFGRPCIIKKPGGGYRMFYSIRRRSLGAYRLGYAESRDGIQWERLDEKLNLDITPGSFDSDTITYAAPLEINGKLYLFYNGNNFGESGFAAAILEDE
jgi:predicted GH43/DUF377 family glycosyl hydrolase